MEFTTECKIGSPRYLALCEWLTEHGFDLNSVPIDAKVVIDGTDVQVDVYVRAGRMTISRSTQHAELVREPSELVRGNA